jgi:hypothetical protein
MKVRKTLKLDKAGFYFDEFRYSYGDGFGDEEYNCVVLKDGVDITLHAYYEKDNGLYCEDIPYTQKVTKGDLRESLNYAEKRRPQPYNHTRKSVFVYPFTGKCKYCHQPLEFNRENFDFGWCHPDCEMDNMVAFYEKEGI